MSSPHEKNLDISAFRIYVTSTNYFTAHLPDIIPSAINFKNKEDVIRFTRKPLQFYQNQFNMVIWCATSGCGLSMDDLLNCPDPLIKTVYRFHLYYQVCKIMHYLQIPLPGDSSFNEIKNNINLRNYGFIKQEFGINDNLKFYMKGTKPEENWPYDYNPQANLDKRLLSTNTDPAYKYPYMFSKDWEEQRSYVEEHEPYFFLAALDKHKHVFDTLKQKDYPRYLHFIPKESQRLTPPGIQRLNDSIRAFVYCLLGAQAQTRTAIVGSYGTQLDAQKQFLKLLEDSIQQHADIPTSIARYQKAISETHVRLDYVIAPGLYIISSNMILEIGKIEHYNNNILIAKPNMKPGKNDINDKIHKSPPLMAGTSVKTIKTKAKSDEPDYFKPASYEPKEPNSFKP